MSYAHKQHRAHKGFEILILGDPSTLCQCTIYLFPHWIELQLQGHSLSVKVPLHDKRIRKVSIKKLSRRLLSVQFEENVLFEKFIYVNNWYRVSSKSQEAKGAVVGGYGKT